jgi:hypothetical protein
MALTGSYDLGDKVYLTWNTVDSSGAAVNPGTVTLSITLPDATNVSVTTATSVTGTYTASYQPTLVGRHILAWSAGTTWPQAYSDIFEVRDINDIGIVGYDEVLEYLNIPSASANENEVRRFIDAATDLAEGYVGQVLGRRTFTDELYDGGVEFIRIRNPKAISITSVYENGALVSSNAYNLDYTGQRLYRIGSGTLYATNSYGYWTGGFNNIKITYVAGYVNPPMSAKQGVLEIIRHLWQTQRGSMSVMGRSLGGDELYTTPTYSLPRRAMELLDPTSFPGLA